MEKNIEDYAGLYLGCPCDNAWFPPGHSERNKDWKLTGFRTGFEKQFHLENEEEETWTDTIIMKLRPLSSMTEEEKEEFVKTQDGFIKQPNTLPSFQVSKVWAAQQTLWFIQRGFDLFGLIESGLALDSTKQPLTQ